ncbi:MAG TPA: CoA transferase [Thermomicrobiales bacterium]|nr:CoA transferase [Thermomicrobiales bacterium]HQZ90149.1 CoA transferase [Thermomicrobiales bacterium]HRA30662.1 CoA transferase [Thermomicrobiales bacterium]
MSQKTDSRGFGPLRGVRVLDLGTMIAAPYAASMLADFGAEVIKVEMPGAGDPSRDLLPQVEGYSVRWGSFSRNKKCVTINLKSPAGRDLFLDLARQADMIVENFRPGTLDRLGLDYETLKQANPRIIVVHISGYGQTGPNRELAGFGTPATAFSGVTYLTGYPDRPPVSPPFSLADYVAGLTGAFAGLMALYYRDTSGDDEGQEVDVSLYEPLFRMLEALVAEFDRLGAVRERAPFVAAGASPAGTYRTADGKWAVLVCSTQRTWERLPAAIGRPELLDDPRFATNADRVAHDDALDALLVSWFGERTYDEAKTRLDVAGCPVSLVYSIADIFADEHYHERESIVEVQHPTVGTLKMPGIIPKLSRTPGRVVFPGPALGEHNRDVFGGLLGLDDEQIRALSDDGAI